MSQAVAAPSTGEPIVTGGKSANPTEMSAGKSAAQSPSRRALLTGLALAPVAAAVPVAAVAAPEDSFARSYRIDAPFWVALERYRRLVDAFEARKCRTFEDERCRDAEIGKPMHEAMTAMGGIGVRTLPALAAKMAAFKNWPDCDVCDGQFTAYEVAVMDIERMMVLEFAS